MSIHETINEVQRRNSIIMEDLEAGTITIGEAITASCSNWEDVVQEILYDLEQIDLTPLNKQNATIISQLANKDIFPHEAAAQSNYLWIEAINKIRRPDMTQFHLSKYHSNNY
ncbi:MAG TPA: hypothetical protein PLS10_08485 [Chitinophagales bacterium]|nr:hypothetical protein [Chitinophagales bacterium]